MQAAIQRHPAMHHHNHTSGCLSCQNGTAINLQKQWRHKGTGASPPNRRRLQTPEAMAPLPGLLPAPTGDISGASCSQIVYLPTRYMYSHTAQCCEYFLIMMRIASTIPILVQISSAKNISVKVEWLSQSGLAPSEPSQRPRWRITPRAASIPRIVLNIALQSVFHRFFLLFRSPILTEHAGGEGQL